jgi:hypothetical protein
LSQELRNPKADPEDWFRLFHVPKRPITKQHLSISRCRAADWLVNSYRVILANPHSLTGRMILQIRTVRQNPMRFTKTPPENHFFWNQVFWVSRPKGNIPITHLLRIVRDELRTNAMVPHKSKTDRRTFIDLRLSIH